MRITVISINQDEVALVRGTSAFGRRGKFGCPLVVGDAVFIAAAATEELRAGRSISVETGYEDISDFAVVEGEEAESMVPTGHACDYRINGRVIHVAPEGMVRVSVRGLTFSLDREDVNGTDPQVNDRVRFQLHGLSLWHTGA